MFTSTPLIVQVQRRHLREGRSGSPDGDAIALAVRDALSLTGPQSAVRVVSREIGWTNDGHRWHLAEMDWRTQLHVWLFDRPATRWLARPFTFILTEV